MLATLDTADAAPLPQSVRDITGTWFVGYTRPQFERRCADHLSQRGIAYYLPICQVRRMKHSRTENRIKKVIEDRVVFPRYIFFAGDQYTPAEAMRTGDLCGEIIHVADQAKLAKQLEDLERSLGYDPFIQVDDELTPGRMCCVTAGPLMGVHGRVEKRHGISRISIVVDILGRSVSMQIDPCLLEPL